MCYPQPSTLYDCDYKLVDLTYRKEIKFSSCWNGLLCLPSCNVDKNPYGHNGHAQIDQLAARFVS